MLKNVTKALGRALTGRGYRVPHGVLLHAVSQVLGQHDWHALRARLTTPELPSSAATLPTAVLNSTLAQPAVSARFHTDDFAYDFEFAINPWLAQASIAELVAVVTSEFCSSEITDRIATSYPQEHAGLAAAFAYLRAVQPVRREPIGFEVRVGPESLYWQWLRRHRPEALALALCAHFDVDLVAAEEPELRGYWDWLEGEAPGRACDYSFDSRAEAAVDAQEQLDLVVRAEKEGLFGS